MVKKASYGDDLYCNAYPAESLSGGASVDGVIEINDYRGVSMSVTIAILQGLYQFKSSKNMANQLANAGSTLADLYYPKTRQQRFFKNSFSRISLSNYLFHNFTSRNVISF